MFWYLATPYSKFEGGLESAFSLACYYAAQLMRCSVPVFSPIAHTHPIAAHLDIDPRDFEFWLAADKPMMDAACGIIVLQAPGWDESSGVAFEVETFTDAGKPIVYWKPGELIPKELLC